MRVYYALIGWKPDLMIDKNDYIRYYVKFTKTRKYPKYIGSY
jgi:hypothetical protein